MVTFTPNYNLGKPDGAIGGDFVDVSVLNTNSDTIDTQIKARADAIAINAADIATNAADIAALQAAVTPYDKRVHVTRAATQSIPNVTPTAIIFDTEIYDTDVMFAGPSAVVTIKTEGLYQIIGYVGFDYVAGGTRECYIEHNGLGREKTDVPATTSLMGIRTMLNIECLVNDTIELIAYQNSGNPVNISPSTNYRSSLQVFRLAA